LLFPALLINLGVHNLFIHTDESRRALVAIEMILSGDYITPTLNGEFYYNKPPVYNWIIALSFQLFGEYSAFALRFPVVVATFIYGALIVFGLRGMIGSRKAALVAIATITSGRILFYDSFLGLIDIAFSAIIFANFLVFYRLTLTKRYFFYFSLSYFLIGVAYLMKGLPPIVFQFFTLLGWLIYTKDWKRIFSAAHLGATLFFIVPVGLYYFTYLTINDHSVSTLIETLWTESSKRTVAEHGILESLKSMLEFPLENLYHFAPWTLLIAALFKKGIFKKLWGNGFMRYLLIIGFLNILVYWTSPEVYPRYLFMFVPLVMAIFFVALEMRSERFNRNLESVFFGILVVACFSPFFVHFAGRSAHTTAYYIELVVIGCLLVFFCILYYRKVEFRWIILGCFLLTLRIGLDFFGLPERNPRGWVFQEHAENIAEITKGKPLHLYLTYIHDGSSFIIARERQEILREADDMEAPGYYIVYEDRALNEGYNIVYPFTTMTNDNNLALVLIK
jgi:4-amino-4-deoxy-L-arabinose transferase-like glycosyltransferase